jgi:hypothetical protein
MKPSNDSDADETTLPIRTRTRRVAHEIDLTCHEDSSAPDTHLMRAQLYGVLGHFTD